MAINAITTPAGLPAPSRRALFGAGAAILAGSAALTVTPATASVDPDQDAELVNLCDQFAANETERHLLMDHDQHAPDFGPNNARYEQLGNEQNRLIKMIEESQSSTTPAGHAAVARAALTWATLDTEGNIECDDFFEELLVKLAQGIAPGFVWPPRPGSCSTVHWARPPSPEEIAERVAAGAAYRAQIDAEIQAKKVADEAERRRAGVPSFMTEDELRGRLEAALDFRARADRLATEASVEMARRGLA